MPTETSELVIFTSVVRHGSFAKAADEHELTPSAVSKLVSRLEEHLGVRLLQRTTRKLALTDVGQSFHARAVQILADLAEAEAEVSMASLRPRGVVRLSAPTVFGRLYVAPLLSTLLQRFPDLSIDLNLSDRFVDLVEEGVDLAIRIGTLSDSRLVARRLCANRRLLVAAPSYLELHGRPETPADLARHECLIFTGLNRPREWQLVGRDGLVSAPVNARLASNNAEALVEAALDGLGIAMGATFATHGALRSGALVRVLPEYEFEPTAMFAVFPSARQLSLKVRAVVDLLSAAFADPPHWDHQLALAPLES